MAAKVITISIQKGGTGKTSISEAIGGIYANLGKKVLLVDMDGQTNLTDMFEVEEKPDCTIYDCLEGKNVKKAIFKTDLLDVVCGDVRVYNFDKKESLRYDELKKILDQVKADYDYIIIDAPPSLGNLQIECLGAADYVLIPVIPNKKCYDAVFRLNETIKEVKSRVNRKLEVLGVVINMPDRRTVSKYHIEQMTNDYPEMGIKVFNTQIRACKSVEEAYTLQKHLIKYEPKCTTVSDIKDLIIEMGV